MHRLIRDISAGMQTLRFLTALVCSATVTTAVAMPMAIKAISYEPPTGLGAAASSQGASAPADAPPAAPTTVSRPQTPPSVAGSAVATTAEPTTTTTPSTTTAAAPPATSASTTAPAVEVASAFQEAQATQETPGGPLPVAPTPEPAPATTAPAPTSTAAPPTTGFGDVFDVTQPCGPNAHELDEDQPGNCDPNANG